MQFWRRRSTVPMRDYLDAVGAEAALIADIEQLIDDAREGEFANRSRDFGRGVALIATQLENILNEHSGGRRGTNRRTRARGGDSRHRSDAGT